MNVWTQEELDAARAEAREMVEWFRQAGMSRRERRRERLRRSQPTAADLRRDEMDPKQTRERWDRAEREARKPR